MKKVSLCVNLFCNCGVAYEDYPTRREALKTRKIECPECKPNHYTWCEYFTMMEEEQ